MSSGTPIDIRNGMQGKIKKPLYKKRGGGNGQWIEMGGGGEMHKRVYGILEKRTGRRTSKAKKE